MKTMKNFISKKIKIMFFVKKIIDFQTGWTSLLLLKTESSFNSFLEELTLDFFDYSSYFTSGSILEFY